MERRDHLYRQIPGIFPNQFSLRIVDSGTQIARIKKNRITLCFDPAGNKSRLKVHNTAECGDVSGCYMDLNRQKNCSRLPMNTDDLDPKVPDFGIYSHNGMRKTDRTKLGIMLNYS